MSRTRSRRRWLWMLPVAFAVLVVFVLAAVVSRLQQLPPPTVSAGLLRDADFSPPVWVGDLESKKVDEASGFARSNRRPDRMWTLNDSGNSEDLHAVGLRGEDHGRVRVKKTRNDDWEDLASFELGGTPYLLIADTGDNLSRKATRVLLAVEEPAFDPGDAPKKVRPVWRLEFRYEDGPRDCEAVGVDATRGEILLLSKRDVPARLYSLRLPDAPSALDGKVAVARFVTEVGNIPQPTEADGVGRFPFGPWLGQPTSLDVSPDGRSALVLTYGTAYVFSRMPDEGWGEAFSRLPERVALPALKGAEAIGYAPGGESFFVTSERRPAPLYRVDALRRP